MGAVVIADPGKNEELSEDPSHLQNYCIAMQPICDGELEHVADELLYRDSATSTFVNVTDEQAMMATARVCHIAFYEIGLERLVGDRQIFINASRDMLLKSELLPPNTEQVVVEVVESVTGDSEVLASLRHIRSLGFKIALDDFVLSRETEPLLEFADIVKVDMMQPFDEQAIGLYKSKRIKLLAEKVEDVETFERLRSMGFDLFQGYFYARPETQRVLSRARSNNHAALVRLVSSMCKYNSDFKEIQNIIVQDPQLTFLLLRYANSAHFPHRGKIETIFQVLLTLGLSQVRNIAITLLIANNGPASKLMLARALIRADMCERLANEMIRHGGEPAFLAGLLSMMSPLLGKSPQAFVKDMSLSEELVDAVIDRRGELGSLLKDVESFENAHTNGWPPKRVEMFNRTWMKSQVWANEVLSVIKEV